MNGSEDLAHEIRAALGPNRVVREVRMFGGLCFMVDEKLVLGAMKGGELLVRTDPQRADELLAITGARQAEMGAGRSMGPSWISVSPEGLATTEAFMVWVDEALAYNTAITSP